MSALRRPLTVATPSMLAMARPGMAMRTSNFINAHRRLLNIQPTRRLLDAKEEQRAHTVSQRLRQLKNIPTELWPLAFIMAVALVAAFYSLIRKTWTDPTLRLWRSGRKED